MSVSRLKLHSKIIINKRTGRKIQKDSLQLSVPLTQQYKLMPNGLICSPSCSRGSSSLHRYRRTLGPSGWWSGGGTAGSSPPSLPLSQQPTLLLVRSGEQREPYSWGRVWGHIGSGIAERSNVEWAYLVAHHCITCRCVHITTFWTRTHSKNRIVLLSKTFAMWVALVW